MHLALGQRKEKRTKFSLKSSFCSKWSLIPQFFLCWLILFLLFLEISLVLYSRAYTQAPNLPSSSFPNNTQDANSQSEILLDNTHYTPPLNSTCSSIDVVYLWVNGSDPLVQQQIITFAGGRVSQSRVRDYGTLKYSFRTVEKFVPWIRNIVLITSGEVPSWLNVSSERLILLKHSDFFPENKTKSSLPTWNSNAIESQFYNLPDTVSPCYIYLNDDFFFYSPMTVEDFLDPETGQQRLTWSGFKAPVKEEKMSNIWHYSISITCNRLLNEWYHPELVNSQKDPKKHEIMQHKYAGHHCYFFQRNVLNDIYGRWPTNFDQTARRRWRDKNDVQVSFLYYNVAKYDYGAQSISGSRNFYGALENDAAKNKKIFKRLKHKNPKCVCFNDAMGEGDRPKIDVMKGIEDFFESFVGEPSSYEIREDGVEFKPIVPAKLERKVKEFIMEVATKESVQKFGVIFEALRKIMWWLIALLIVGDAVWISSLLWRMKNSPGRFSSSRKV